MDINDSAFIQLWQMLNEHGVRYILVGGFATNLHGYQRFTGDVNIYLEDKLENRKAMRRAYFAYSGIDFQSFETIQFVPGWIEFPLNDGTRLDIITKMVGIDVSFDECLAMAKKADFGTVQVPVLHIQHLIANKKAVGRPKDLLDVENLERIKKEIGE